MPMKGVENSMEFLALQAATLWCHCCIQYQVNCTSSYRQEENTLYYQTDVFFFISSSNKPTVSEI